MYYFYSAYDGFSRGSLADCWRRFRHVRAHGGQCGIYADEPPAGRWVRWQD